MRRARTAAILAAAALAAALAGCSASSVVDRLPTDLGLPEGTPARPAEAYQYPAVHDMPPPRPDQPLSDEQQVKMEKDLEKVRDRQVGRTKDAADKSGKKAAQTGKKQPTDANASQTDGGKANP